MFYKLLERDREFNHPKWPFLIKVRDVQGSKMIDATFKHKVKGRQRIRCHHPGQDGRAAFRSESEAGPRLPRGRRDPASRAGRRRRADQQQRSWRFRFRPTASSTWRRKSRNTPTPRSQPSWPRTSSLIATVRKARSDQGRFRVRAPAGSTGSTGATSIRRSAITPTGSGSATSSRPNGSSGSRWRSAACCS